MINYEIEKDKNPIRTYFEMKQQQQTNQTWNEILIIK